MNFEVIKENKNILRSISLSILLKPISVIISLFYTPALLNFLGQEQYGIWQTLLSILNWITVFDFGINGGFTLLLTAAIVKDDSEEIKRIVSTAYSVVSVLFTFLYTIVLILVFILNWQSILNTTVNMKYSVLIVATYTCICFIFSLTNSIFCANQKAEFVPLLQTVIQLLNLVNILFIAKMFSNYGNKIFLMSLIYFVDGVAVNLIVISIIWKIKRNYIPHIKYFDKTRVKKLFSFGIKLFIIQISGLVLFMTDNLIITHLYSPDSVTPYSITYNMFNLFYVMFCAIIQPMWSKYAMEKEKKNFLWIKKSLIIQLGIFLLVSLCITIAMFVFKPFTLFWFKKDIGIPMVLTITIGVYNMLLIFCSIFTTLLNGTGNLNLTLITSIIGAVINIPLSIYFAKYVNLGLTGVALATITSLLPNVFCLPIKAIHYINSHMRGYDGQ